MREKRNVCNERTRAKRRRVGQVRGRVGRRASVFPDAVVAAAARRRRALAVRAAAVRAEALPRALELAEPGLHVAARASSVTSAGVSRSFFLFTPPRTLTSDSSSSLPRGAAARDRDRKGQYFLYML